MINTCVFFVLRDLISWLEFTLILRMKLSPAFWQQNPLNCLTNCTYNGRTVYLWFKLRDPKVLSTAALHDQQWSQVLVSNYQGRAQWKVSSLSVFWTENLWFGFKNMGRCFSKKCLLFEFSLRFPDFYPNVCNFFSNVSINY